MSSTNQRVYVFVCGQSEYLGLSLDESGKNLPACLAPPHTWSPFDDVAFDPTELDRFNINVATAIESLKSRGYHIAQPAARVLRFESEKKARY
jgi:hypothetical protein